MHLNLVMALHFAYFYFMLLLDRMNRLGLKTQSTESVSICYTLYGI